MIVGTDATMEVPRGIILGDIIANFEGKTFDPKGRTGPVLITKDNVNDPNLWGNAGKKK